MAERRHHLDKRADLLIAPSLADGDPDDLLSPKVVAQVIDVSPATLPGWRNRGVGPPFKRLSPRCVRYPRGGLLAWLRSRTDKVTTPPPPKRVHVARREHAARMRKQKQPPVKPVTPGASR